MASTTARFQTGDMRRGNFMSATRNVRPTIITQTQRMIILLISIVARPLALHQQAKLLGAGKTGHPDQITPTWPLSNNIAR